MSDLTTIDPYKCDLEDDSVRDIIHDDAENAAMNAWGPLGSPNHRECPFPKDSPAAEIWWIDFNSSFARENGH
jgi:hypothetical protein